MPVWWEPIEPTEDMVALTDTIQVVTTDYSDLRVGGLVVLWEDAMTFETQAIASFTKTSITFTSALEQSHSALTTWVYPVRLGFVDPSVTGPRRAEEIHSFRLTFSAGDNNVDLSDTSAFPTFNGKVLLEEPNWIASQGGVRVSMLREQNRQDGVVGPFLVTTEADVDREKSTKRFLSTTRQRLWEVRQLLHALKGRQVSFYVPTFARDFTPNMELGAGDNKLDFDRYGYTDFVQSRTPRDAIWIRFTDGTTLVRNVD